MKYSEEVLEDYGIYPFGDGRYLLKEHSTNTNYFSNTKLAEKEGICLDCSTLKNIKIDDLKIKKDDVLMVFKQKDITNLETKICITNLDNNTEGTVVGYYYSDDGRFDLVNAIANMFKDIENVVVVNFLIYTEEEIENYIEALNDI